jgi:hypothetical protein
MDDRDATSPANATPTRLAQLATWASGVTRPAGALLYLLGAIATLRSAPWLLDEATARFAASFSRPAEPRWLAFLGLSRPGARGSRDR